MRWYTFQRTHPIRLEPMPWTGRERRRKRLPEITATVVAKSEWGIQIKEGEWWNWSKPEYRGEPFNTEVQKGDRVQITYAETDGGKTYITSIGKVTAGSRPVPDEQRLDEEGWEDFRETSPDAPSEPSGPAAGLGVVVDRDHSIVRQTCIKAASVALQHNMGNQQEKAGMITYLAGVLEDWCWR